MEEKKEEKKEKNISPFPECEMCMGPIHGRCGMCSTTRWRVRDGNMKYPPL